MSNAFGYISVGFIDSEGVPASTHLPVLSDNTKTLAAIAADVGTIATALAALSEDGLTEVKYTLVVDSTRTTPTADSDSQEGLLINYNVQNTKYPQEVWVPALIDALTVNGKIDLSNAALLAFTNAYTALTTTFGCNGSSLIITTLRDAAEAFRKLRRLATKKSRSIA